MEKQGRIIEKADNPINQAAVSLVGAVGMMLLGKLASLIGLMEVSTNFPWKSAAAFLLFFAIFNSVFSLATSSLSKYWQRSIYSFMGLAASAGIAAWLFSGIPIGEAGSYKWIYFVVGIGYLVFISIIGFMRKIVEFAQKEEWEQPQIRKRK